MVNRHPTNQDALDKNLSEIEVFLSDLDKNLENLKKPQNFENNLNGWLFELSYSFMPVMGDFEEFDKTIEKSEIFINLKTQCNKRNIKLALYPDLQINDHVHILAPSTTKYSLLFSDIKPTPHYFSKTILWRKGYVYKQEDAVKLQKEYYAREDDLPDVYMEIMTDESTFLTNFCRDNNCRLVDTMITRDIENFDNENFSWVFQDTVEIRYLFEQL